MTTLPPSARPNIAISEERVKELREWLIENEYTKIDGIEIPSLRVRQMLAILDDYSALKEENERLTKLLSEYQKSGLREGGLFLHAGQIAADLATDRCRLIADNNCLKAELAVAQMTNAKNGAVIIEQMVALEHQRPLVEAAMGATISKYQDVTGGSSVLIPFFSDGDDDILRAALALREEKK